MSSQPQDNSCTDMKQEHASNFNMQFNRKLYLLCTYRSMYDFICLEFCSLKSNQSLSIIPTHTETIHMPLKQERFQSLHDIPHATASTDNYKSNTGSTWSI